MMAGVTSPARPWFRLSVPDLDAGESSAGKLWLHTVTSRMQTVFLRSNLYNSLPILYKDMGVFATSAMWIEEDFDNVIHTHVFQIGEYMIANDKRNKVRVLFREFRMTVRQIVEEFAEVVDGKIVSENVSDRVRTCYNENRLEEWIDVNHVVTPNREYNPNLLESKFKKYVSYHYETGSDSKQDPRFLDDKQDKFLRISGFDFFPLLAPPVGRSLDPTPTARTVRA